MALLAAVVSIGIVMGADAVGKAMVGNAPVLGTAGIDVRTAGIVADTPGIVAGTVGTVVTAAGTADTAGGAASTATATVGFAFPVKATEGGGV